MMLPVVFGAIGLMGAAAATEASDRRDARRQNRQIRRDVRKTYRQTVRETEPEIRREVRALRRAAGREGRRAGVPGRVGRSMFERGFLMGLADLGEEVADLENELFDELPPTYLEEDLFGYDDFDDEFGAEYSRMDMLGFDDDEFEDLFFDHDDEEYGRKYRQRRIR
jgi:hypothetical protein